MPIELSEQQRHSLEAGKPVEVSEGGRTFYVVAKEHYDRMKALLEAERIDPSLFEVTGEVYHEKS